MNIAKLTEEQLKGIFPPDILERAEGSIGQLCDCEVRAGDLYGKIRGNHGNYSAVLRTSQNPVNFECSCKADKGCKHAAALGLSYIMTPWIFTSEDKIDRKKLSGTDDIYFYISITSLRDLVEELKNKGISLARLAEITKISPQQVSSIIKSAETGTPHAWADMLKLACLYLIEHS